MSGSIRGNFSCGLFVLFAVDFLLVYFCICFIVFKKVLPFSRWVISYVRPSGHPVLSIFVATFSHTGITGLLLFGVSHVGYASPTGGLSF